MTNIPDRYRDRAIRLIDYLIELARLRSKVVREIEDYKQFLWLNDIPKEPNYCFVQAWQSNEEYDADTWIEITKYDEPILDEVPEICVEWVDDATLNNTEEAPKLYPSIIVPIEAAPPNGEEDQDEPLEATTTLKLEDFPSVNEAWGTFIESAWASWAEEHKKWQAIHDVYARLFTIHQELQKLGEEFELVVGIGLLTWRTPTGHVTKRHLLVAKAALTFDPRTGKFTVTPSADGAKLSVELDMLDIEDQPRGSEQSVSESLLLASDNLWHRPSIDPILSALANSLGEKGQGEYRKNNFAPLHQYAQAKPVIEYAPALILRRRSAQALEDRLKEIRKNIASGDVIPPVFLDLCEGQLNDEDFQDYVNSFSLTEEDQEIYFPKLSNEEQRQIIVKLRSSNGVLVQGPPGTGKSHTIANLISHLLATGKRVLVTAKTARALQVLHEKLPEQLRPLCINLLGSGIKEQESLEASVRGILTEQDRWSDRSADEQIKCLVQKIHDARTEQAKINRRIRAIREEETFHHIVADGAYSGTAAKIALLLRKESLKFVWFIDRIDTEVQMPVSQADLIQSQSLLASLTPELEIELQQLIPDPQCDLPSQKIFEDLTQRRLEAQKRLSNSKDWISTTVLENLKQSEPEIIHSIIEAISQLIGAIKKAGRNPTPWIKDAIGDVLCDKVLAWKELLRISSETISGLRERSKIIDTQSLVIPNGVDRKKALADATVLKKHFEAGGNLGWSIFKPEVVRKNKYIVESVLIDGRACNSLEAVNSLIERFSVEQTIDYAWNLWFGKSTRLSGPAFMQVAELENLQESLSVIVALQKPLSVAKTAINSVRGLDEPDWTDLGELQKLLSSCEYIMLKGTLDQINEQLNQYILRIRAFSGRPNAHQVSAEALNVLMDGRTDAYPGLLRRINQLRESSERLKQAKITLQKLSLTAPMLAEELSRDPRDSAWPARLGQFERAWNWSRVNSWLQDFLKKDDLPSLERQAKHIEDDLLKDLAELSSVKAWKFCLNRMEESHRRNLIGWQQEINKIGKGTGKYVGIHRSNAQKHLNGCREAVPAWIMPLHRVYETVRSVPGMFDVIIVDEASQCGPEALPLSYLTNRLLVVGDDQQISPEAVGVGREQVYRLMDKYLKDFEHANSFDIENSLFDHAKRRFKGRIVLREHFRCMPEIIRFSNDLCYRATPLIPLRQYPPERFHPLKPVFVEAGYREGDGAKVINRPEAEALVETIVQCCEDDRYEEKTMGVIVLQGEAQASLIENLLLNELGAEEMERRRLICGNPYSFQGDERDIIFMSMVAAPNQQIGAFTKAADQRRFNVAGSRARDQMWLFHSVTQNDLSEHCLRRRLLEYFADPTSQITMILGEEAEQLRGLAQMANRSIERPPRPYDSWFELDVVLLVASNGFRVIPQYHFAGKYIDLMIEGTKSRLAVECDGDYWHGADEYEKDMERQRKLERSGLIFHRIRECEFNANPNQVVEHLKQKLAKMGIETISKTSIAQNDAAITDTNRNLEVNEAVCAEADQTRTLVRQGRLFTRAQLIASTAPTHAISIRNIQNALAMKPAQLKQTVIETLMTRPNCSCVKDHLPGLVLKHLQVISRGKPREDFSRKVNRVLKQMQEESVIEIYKSKNVRIRLIDSI